MPVNNHMESNLRELFDIEVKFWELDRGLARVETLTGTYLKEKIETLLRRAPQIDQKKQTKCIEMWQSLGPLSIEEIAQSSQVAVDFDE